MRSWGSPVPACAELNKPTECTVGYNVIGGDVRCYDLCKWLGGKCVGLHGNHDECPAFGSGPKFSNGEYCDEDGGGTMACRFPKIWVSGVVI